MKSLRWRWLTLDIIIIAYCLVPIIWLISLSVKPPAYLYDGKFIPRHITAENYRAIFSNSYFVHALINSVGIVIISTAVAVLLASCAAYALVRLPIRGRNWIIALFILVTIFPQISLITPLFEMERELKIFDTWIGLIIPYTVFGLPLALFIVMSYFVQLPTELETAAMMDGARFGQIVRYILFPLAIPGMITAAIIVFISSWNDLLLAMSLTATSQSQTAPVAIVNFTGSNQFEAPTGSIAAAAIVVTVPLLGFVIFFQRKIISGLTAGAIKG